MSERDDWTGTVTGLADQAGLTKGRASYPEPEKDNEAVAYLRHLADNLQAIPVNRARAEAVAFELRTATGDHRADLVAQSAMLEDEHAHLIEVVARHGYKA